MKVCWGGSLSYGVEDPTQKLSQIQQTASEIYWLGRQEEHKNPKFWFEGPRQGDSRNHALQDPYAYVLFWAPIPTRGSHHRPSYVLAAALVGQFACGCQDQGLAKEIGQEQHDGSGY